jgi:ariadne-1
MSLDRYFYHYDRWVANYSSLEKVREDMEELETSEIRRIATMVDLDEKNLAFLTEAYEQIAHGRRVLKWAYAYGYYLDPVRDAAKRGLFEHLLDQANSRLDKLHDAAELERLQRRARRRLGPAQVLPDQGGEPHQCHEAVHGQPCQGV